jgi:hypothetical protein
MVERSRQETDLLKGYGDTVLRAEALKKELEKSKKHSALLQFKLDGAITQYHNEAQEMQEMRDDLIQKNKLLRQKNKGVSFAMVSEYLL